MLCCVVINFILIWVHVTTSLCRIPEKSTVEDTPIAYCSIVSWCGGWGDLMTLLSIYRTRYYTFYKCCSGWLSKDGNICAFGKLEKVRKRELCNNEKKPMAFINNYVKWPWHFNGCMCEMKKDVCMEKICIVLPYNILAANSIRREEKHQYYWLIDVTSLSSPYPL